MPPPPASGDLNSHPEFSALRSPRISMMQIIIPHLFTKFDVGRPSRSEHIDNFRSRRYAVWWPWPLTFWPWNWWGMSAVARTTVLPLLVFLQHFVVDLWANMHQMTTWPYYLDLWPLTSPRMSVMRVMVLHPWTKFGVRRSPPSEDIARFRLSINRLRDLEFWYSDL